MNNISGSLKNRFFGWLDRQLAAQRIPPPPLATLAPGAVIGTEGIIDNLRGGKNSVTIGGNSFVRGRLLTYGHGGQITIGDWSYIGVRGEIWSMNSITIGNRVLIAHDVNINDGSAHSMNAAERHTHFRHIIEKGHPTTADGMPGVYSAPIVIEDDVWISFGVTILQGVTIGAGSVIAAGSLVTKDVPPGMLYRCEVKPVMTPLEDINELKVTS